MQPLPCFRAPSPPFWTWASAGRLASPSLHRRPLGPSTSPLSLTAAWFSGPHGMSVSFHENIGLSPKAWPWHLAEGRGDVEGFSSLCAKPQNEGMSLACGLRTCGLRTERAESAGTQESRSSRAGTGTLPFLSPGPAGSWLSTEDMAVSCSCLHCRVPLAWRRSAKGTVVTAGTPGSSLVLGGNRILPCRPGPRRPSGNDFFRHLETAHMRTQSPQHPRRGAP